MLTNAQMVLLGDAIKKRKAQLDNWFRNQMNKQRCAAPVKSQSGESIAELLFKKKKKTRGLRPIELFQKRNKEKIDAAGYNAIGEPDADDNWVDESDGTRVAEAKSEQSMRMRVRTRVVKALYDAEPIEVRMGLEEDAAKAKLAKSEGAQEGNEEEGSTPRSYLQSIDELTEVYGRVHHATLKKAGWVAITITGGPNPRFNSELSMKVDARGPASGREARQAGPAQARARPGPMHGF
ncbi:hypothetical protein C8J57DRAFT_1230128 [Mycena rebaudengoi]|nr:hypothetical protein C8J57DRAFT_1230128 [Mycena rebaudengoi]